MASRNSIRDWGFHNQRYHHGVSRLHKSYNMKKKILILVILAILFGFSFIIKATAESPAPSPEEAMKAALLQYDTDMEEWLDGLARCESGNDASQVTYNDGGSPSYGLVQFKLGTFWSYNNKYRVFPELTIDNLHKYVMEGEKQRIMARVIIERNHADYRNWYNCTVGKSPNKVGLPPQKP